LIVEMSLKAMGWRWQLFGTERYTDEARCMT